MTTTEMTDLHSLDEHEWTGYFPEHLASRLSYLHGLAIALGCGVVVGTYVDPSLRRYGDYWAPEHRIRINALNHGYQAVDTLAHEIGHAIHRHDQYANAEFEAAADRVALALILDEKAFLEHFDPDRHLYVGANRNIRETVELFGCGWKMLRRRHEIGPSANLDEGRRALVTA